MSILAKGGRCLYESYSRSLRRAISGHCPRKFLTVSLDSSRWLDSGSAADGAKVLVTCLGYSVLSSCEGQFRVAGFLLESVLLSWLVNNVS